MNELYSLLGQPGFYFIFMLSKNKGFQTGALLKMPPSSLSMKKLRLEIRNE